MTRLPSRTSAAAVNALLPPTTLLPTLLQVLGAQQEHARQPRGPEYDYGSTGEHILRLHRNAHGKVRAQSMDGTGQGQGAVYGGHLNGGHHRGQRMRLRGSFQAA
jgi:hypothetical protein